MMIMKKQHTYKNEACFIERVLNECIDNEIIGKTGFGIAVTLRGEMVRTIQGPVGVVRAAWGGGILVEEVGGPKIASPSFISVRDGTNKSATR